ncbi:hypothetical protein BGX21_005352 [Mortierella sp. AD011]|nr:hypothetical protein BGX21_005352 [Mortierella sp. AD011]
MLHRKLLESEVKSDLKGKFCNTGFVDDPYEDVNEGCRREPVVGVVPNSVTAQTSSQKTSPPKPLSEMLSLAEKPSSKKPEEQHKALSPQMKSRKTAKESSKTHNAGKRGDRELLLHLRENMKKGDLSSVGSMNSIRIRRIEPRYERLDKSKFSTLSSEYWQKCGECPIRSKYNDRCNHERMYRKTSSAFATNDLSEAYWGRNSWPILMTLMDDIPNIFMIDGEKFGLESPRRRNHGRQLIQDLTTAKKKDGQEV